MEWRDGLMAIVVRCRECERVAVEKLQVGMVPGSRQGGPLDLKSIHFPKVCQFCGVAGAMPVTEEQMSKPSVQFEANVALAGAGI